MKNMYLRFCCHRSLSARGSIIAILTARVSSALTFLKITGHLLWPFRKCCSPFARYSPTVIQVCIDLLIRYFWLVLKNLFAKRFFLKSDLLWRLIIVAFCVADPLVGSIATQYLQNREEHDRVARLWTKRYATWLRTVSCPVVLFFVVVASSFSSASSPSSLCRPSGSISHFIRIAIIAWRHHCYFCFGIIFSSTLFGPSLRIFFSIFRVQFHHRRTLPPGHTHLHTGTHLKHVQIIHLEDLMKL